MYKLVIQDDEGKTTVVPLIRDELTIGRKEGNTIRLTERNVSRRHARLVRQNGSIAIEDLGSYNGIRVNGTRIQGRAAIKETDRVQIGDYLIEIKAEAGDKAEARPAPSRTADVPVPEVDTAVDTAAQPTHRIASGDAGAPAHASVEPDPDAPTETATHARLVALSRLFAGTEFELAKPAVVIGRTPDNDVALDHRSISRHHAKVLREGGRTFIVDLQSSNGVRVNGEEYGKVELRRGDVIDLGHVRLRFVEPGEDFVFGRDAHAVDTDGGGGGRAMLWVALALLVGAAVAAVLFLEQKGPAATSVREAPSMVRPAPAVPPPAPPLLVDEGPGASAANPPVAADAGPASAAEPGALDRARQAAAAERWGEALAGAREALAADPHDADAKALLDAAKRELEPSRTFAEAQRAAQAGRPERAAELARRIGEGSVYRERAKAVIEAAAATYIAAQAEAGRKLAERGRCREQRRLAAQAEKAFGSTAGDAVRATACHEPVAASASPPAAPAPASAPTPAPVDGAVAEAPVNLDATLAEAKAAGSNSQYGKALHLCQIVLNKRPNDVEAARTCVIAACNLRNPAVAKKYIDKVGAEQKVPMTGWCLSIGVHLE